MSTTTANGPSREFTENLAKYQAQNPNLTVSDVQVYNINKGNYFAGTIAVCVIYGVFSLVLLLLTIFSPTGSTFITETFRTFTITFIVGMLIATILLTIAIVTFKPSVLSQNPYDAHMCPDYWTFEKTKTTSAPYNSSNVTNANKSLMDYQCKPPPGLEPDNASKPEKLDEVTGILYSDYSTSLGDSATLNCSQVFPLLLNYKNATNTKINNVPNALACSYAKQCGVSWSAMCPNGDLGTIK